MTTVDIPVPCLAASVADVSKGAVVAIGWLNKLVVQVLALYLEVLHAPERRTVS